MLNQSIIHFSAIWNLVGFVGTLRMLLSVRGARAAGMPSEVYDSSPETYDGSCSLSIGCLLKDATASGVSALEMDYESAGTPK